MTDFPESHRDLLDAQVGTFATIGPNGAPQLTVVWILHDDGQLKTSLNTGRAKYRNLQGNPQCSMLILDPQNSFRYLEVRGRAEITADDDYVFAQKVGEKYGGADLRAYDEPGTTRVVVTIVPEKINAVDMSG